MLKRKTRRVLAFKKHKFLTRESDNKREKLFLRSKPLKNVVRVSLNIFLVVSIVEYTTSTKIRRVEFFYSMPRRPLVSSLVLEICCGRTWFEGITKILQ